MYSTTELSGQKRFPGCWNALISMDFLLRIEQYNHLQHPSTHTLVTLSSIETETLQVRCPSKPLRLLRRPVVEVRRCVLRFGFF